MRVLVKNLLSAVAIVGVSMSMVSCGKEDTERSEPRSVSLGMAVKDDLSGIALALADSRGIFDEFGINAELAYFQGGGPLVQAMSGGKVDFGWVSNTAVVNAVENGASLNIIAEISRTGVGWGLVVPEESPLKSLDDMSDGVKIAYTSEGTLTNWLALYEAQLAGVAPGNVQGVPLGGSLPTYTKALEQGEVDAAIVILPWGETLTADGKFRWLARMTDQLPDFSFSGIVASDAQLSDAKAAGCLLGAYAASVRWMKDNPTETQRLMIEQYHVDQSIVDSVYNTLIPDFNPDGKLDPDRLQAMIDRLGSVPGFVKGVAKAKDIASPVSALTKEECGVA